MKLTLTLVIVSLSVLTAAKLEIVREDKDHHHHECGNQTTHSGNTTYPGTPIQSPPSTPSQSPLGTPSNDSTPTTPLTPSGTPSLQVRVDTTTQSSGYVQNPKGSASFTAYSGCQYACKSWARSFFFSSFKPTLSATLISSTACGQRVNGFSAAVNQLAFGASSGAGGACGRCFKISANYDPYTPSYAGPWGNTIVVKVNDLCPATSNNVDWCAQTVSHPLNAFNEPMQ
jgi:hypothetical protein